MTDNHPITVPAGSITGWKLLYCNYQGDLSETEYIVLKSAQLGADQELEACLLWLGDRRRENRSQVIALRAARRPKPPSLKEQALQLLETYNTSGVMLTADQADTIRRALEALDD